MPEDESNINDSVEAILRLLTRRRWWILAGACSVALVSAGAVSRLPKKYTSDATLVVVQPQISSQYVTPPATVAPPDAVRSMTREVLSRPRLLRIIEELRLYPTVKRSDQLAEHMRESINVVPIDNIRNSFDAFKISFDADDPHLAQSVTSRLASLFMEESLRTRGDQAEGTARFLSERLEEIKQKLVEQESRLKDFKLRNVDRLPEAQAIGLATLTGLQNQLQITTDRLTRAEQSRSSLEALLTGNLARLGAERSLLLTTFTPRHRDVLKKDEEIARAQALLDRLRGGTVEERRTTPQAVDDDTTVQLRSQVDAVALEIDSRSNEEKKLRRDIANYQSRLDAGPVKEQQLAEILRDYEQYKRDYDDLLNKKLQSQLTVSLEERQGGQHFRLIDPPTLSIVPSSPDRGKLLLIGVAASVAFGLALAFFVDIKDRSFHNQRELCRSYQLPLVIGIPPLLTIREERARRRQRALEGVAAFAMVVTVLAIEFYTYHG